MRNILIAMGISGMIGFSTASCQGGDKSYTDPAMPVSEG